MLWLTLIQLPASIIVAILPHHFGSIQRIIVEISGKGSPANIFVRQDFAQIMGHETFVNTVSNILWQA